MISKGLEAFRSDSENPDFTTLSLYCKILPGMSCAHVSGFGGVGSDNDDWEYWYKVVPVK